MDIINTHYEIIEKLGEGGAGITYKAKDLRNDEFIAIKIISFRQITDWKTLDLFEREVRVLKQLDHPTIPKYLDSFEIDTAEDRLFCIVQALAPGKNLAQWMKEGWQPTEAETQAIATQLLEVLIYLQQLTPAIIHRDIKPQNILRDEQGNVYLVDFGAVQDTYRQTVTGGSTVIGTFGYMAPEQFRGQANLATDLFGLGTTLVYLLTGKDPIELPQTENLKLNLPTELSISLPFRHWLENLIEPAVEERCLCAADAMLYFQGQEQPVVSGHQTIVRPKKTAISLTKTQSYLRIHFLPQNFRHPDIVVALTISVFSLIYFLFFLYWFSLLGLSSSINLVFIFFMLIFSGLTFGFGVRSMQILTKPVVLLVNEDFIYLRGVLKPFQFYLESSFSLDYIDEIYLKKKSPRKTTCIIKTIEQETFYLGSYLSLTENRWLVQELQEFVRAAKSNKFAEKHKQLMALKDRRVIAIDIILAKGIFYYGKKDFKNARHIFETALLIEPTCAEIHNNLGVTQVQAQGYSQAIESFHYALHYAPSYWAARVNLAMTYELQGNLEKSIKTYATPCPSGQKTGQDEYTLLLVNEPPFTLLENITSLQAENPVNSASLKTKGDYAYFLQLQGNTDAALYAHDDARKLADGKSAEIVLLSKKQNTLEQTSRIYANLGWTLAISGQINKALKYLNKSYVIDCNIKNPNAQRTKALMEYYQQSNLRQSNAEHKPLIIGK